MNSKIFKSYYFKPYFKYYNNTLKPKNILSDHREQQTKKSMATNKHVSLFLAVDIIMIPYPQTPKVNRETSVGFNNWYNLVGYSHCFFSQLFCIHVIYGTSHKQEKILGCKGSSIWYTCFCLYSET